MDYWNHTLLRRRDVEQLTGLSKSTIYSMIPEGRFPRPVQISRGAVAWRASDLDEWMMNCPDAGQLERGDKK